jgi:acetyl esterase/lipase
MKLLQYFLLPFGSLLALCSCSGTDILNLTVPKSGYTVHHDISYGDNPRQNLDIYVPDTLSDSHSVIIFYYGGSWQTGNKEQYRFVGQAFASKGYITVIADYRLYPEVSFPVFLDDSAQAFTWVHNNINAYGGNPDNIFLSGHSAGGYLAVMLTLNESYIKKAHGDTSWIKGTIGIAGPYDFLPFTDPKIKALFSTAPDANTQPINYVHVGLPPILLVTGDKDTSVLSRNSYNLAAKIREAGEDAEVHTYPGVAHIGVIISASNLFRSKAPVLEDVSKFVEKTATKP